jgi:hypothetical protein
VSSGRFVIADAQRRIVVGPTIEAYGVAGTLVFGRRVADGRTTCFIVDTKTRHVSIGLQREEWRRELARMGVDKPEIFPPSRPGWFSRPR